MPDAGGEYRRVISPELSPELLELSADPDSGAPTNAMFWESQYEGKPENVPLAKTIPE
jgi:hypothetical protein